MGESNLTRNLILVAVLVSLSVGLFGFPDDGDETLALGSTTLHPIMNEFKAEYESEDPEFILSVTGGGSGQGVNSVAMGTADIGMTSREVRDIEQEAEPDLKSHVIGLDGLAIVVGSNAGVSDLTLDQVKGIYSGDINNWEEVGGNDAPIFVNTREAGSGTFDCFDRIVMDGAAIDFDNEVNSNGGMKGAVSGNPNAIGYVGFNFLGDDITAVSIVVDGEAVAPSKENVMDGSYPLHRYLILVTNGEPEGALKDFMEWTLSPAAQAIVEEAGYIPLP